MLRKIGGVCGIISPIGGWTVLLLIIANSPWFNWREEYISVFGVAGRTTWLFNNCLIITGILSLIFAAGLGKSLAPSKLSKMSMTSLILSSLTLSAMGILPRTTYLPHNLASMASFTFTALSLFLVGIVAITTSQRVWGALSLTAGILTIVFQIVPWPWSGGAISQLLSYLPWSLWMIGSGLKLLVGVEPINA